MMPTEYFSLTAKLESNPFDLEYEVHTIIISLEAAVLVHARHQSYSIEDSGNAARRPSSRCRNYAACFG